MARVLVFGCWVDGVCDTFTGEGPYHCARNGTNGRTDQTRYTADSSARGLPPPDFQSKPALVLRR